MRRYFRPFVSDKFDTIFNSLKTYAAQIVVSDVIHVLLLLFSLDGIALVVDHGVGRDDARRGGVGLHHLQVTTWITLFFTKIDIFGLSLFRYHFLF